MNATHLIASDGAFIVRALARGQRPNDVIAPGERFASAEEVRLEMEMRERRRRHGSDADWRHAPSAEYELAANLTRPLTAADLDALNAAANGGTSARRRRTRPIHVPGLTPNRAEVDVDEEFALMLEYANTLDPLPAAVYIAWRLTWLHPFMDGSGRTSRAAAYAMLCRDPAVRAAHQRRGGAIGVQRLTVPERIERSRREYLACVNAGHLEADRGDRYERFVDLSRLERYISRLAADQVEGRPSLEDKACGCP